jgi:hypothetical protein
MALDVSSMYDSSDWRNLQSYIMKTPAGEGVRARQVEVRAILNCTGVLDSWSHSNQGSGSFAHQHTCCQSALSPQQQSSMACLAVLYCCCHAYHAAYKLLLKHSALDPQLQATCWSLTRAC